MINETTLIKKCCALITNKLSWGDSAAWQNQDFERLSQLILQETGTHLSISTLKRLWGKVHYTSRPNLATLDALARFVGHDHWRSFTASQAYDGKLKRPLAYRKPLLAGALALTFLLLGSWWWSRHAYPTPLKFSNVSFSSDPVTKGIPNTVIFRYDATDSNADSVFIQQSWDQRLRAKVDKGKHEYACTYYYPGFYRAKLVLNDSIVKEHPLYIESDGWLGTADVGSIPVYFTKEDITKGDIIGLTAADLKARKILLEKESLSISFYQIDKSIQLPSDNFQFETELQSTYSEGNAVCQYAEIFFFCENGRHLIPFCIKGCVGEISLILGNKKWLGKTTDLSNFGVDFSDWVKVRLAVENKHARIFINEQPAFEGDFTDDIGPIAGYRISFAGTGQIKNTRIKEVVQSGVTE